MADLNTLTIENVITGVTGLAALFAIVDSRLSRRKYNEEKAKERELVATEKGSQEEKMKNLVIQLNDAHDKIRILESSLNNINVTVLRVKDSIDQFTIVLNKVASFMDNNLIQITNIDTRLKGVESSIEKIQEKQ